MIITDILIKDLKPAEYNPRQLSEKQFKDLQASFNHLKILEPAVVNSHKGRENVIISGHQRIRVAESLGHKEYPCFLVDFDIKKEKEANIRMNQNGGGWDFDVLANNFDTIELVEWGFDEKMPGFSTDFDTTPAEFMDNNSKERKKITLTCLADEFSQFKYDLEQLLKNYESVSVFYD